MAEHSPIPVDAVETGVTRDDTLSKFVRQLRRMGETDRGGLARLRRTHPWRDRTADFDLERLLVDAGVDTGGIARRRWALIVHCLALTPLDRPFEEPGVVLADLRFGESRLRQLLEADADTLGDLLPRLARRIAAAGRGITWWPFVTLLSTADAGAPSQPGDAARLRLVRHYLTHRPRDTDAA